MTKSPRRSWWQRLLFDPEAGAPGISKVTPTSRVRTKENGIQPEPLIKAQLPITCDCGTVFQVSAFGLSEDSELLCPKCGKSDRLDEDTVAEVRESIRNALLKFFDDNGIEEPDGEVLEFMILHNRVPTDSEIRAGLETREQQGYPVGIVGESNYQPAVARCVAGEQVTLVREPTNPYDPRAIAVVSARDEIIGYIARDHWLMEAVHKKGRGVDAVVWKILDGGTGMSGVVLDLQVIDGPLKARDFRR